MVCHIYLYAYESDEVRKVMMQMYLFVLTLPLPCYVLISTLQSSVLEAAALDYKDLIVGQVMNDLL